MPSDPRLLSELERVVRAGGAMAQEARAGLETTVKPDGSLVTNADREVETFLRSELASLVPGATFWGEEFGLDTPVGDDVWLIDPVDGTSNFSFGQPLWGVTVALIRSGTLAAGVVTLPDLERSFAAAPGLGATLNGEPLALVKPGPIKRFELVGHADDGCKAFDFLPGKRRHFGSFVVEAMFVSTGYFRAMTATKAKLYDIAGSLVVMREAGLEVRALDGSPFDEGKWLVDEKCEPFAVVPPGAWEAAR